MSGISSVSSNSNLYYRRLQQIAFQPVDSTANGANQHNFQATTCESSNSLKYVRRDRRGWRFQKGCFTMLAQYSRRDPIGGKVLIVLFTCAWLFSISTAFGQGCGGHNHGSHDGEHHAHNAENKPSESPYKEAPLPPHFYLTRHGGLYLTPAWNTYEVVFLPYQTRIYLYDKKWNPLSTKDVHAEMSLDLSNQNNTIKIPFQYVVQPAGSTEQDYVAANFNAMQVVEKETPIAIEFCQLSDRHHPKETFTPLVSQSQIRSYVAQVSLTTADRDGVFRQRICPVSGKTLGIHGPISKLLIGDYPLYLCCDGCIDTVQTAPEKYSPHPPVPQGHD